MEIWHSLIMILDSDKLGQFCNHYRSLGLILAFGLPFIESFIPIVPFSLLVIINVNAYGLLLGFLISFLASLLGSLGIFLLSRKFSHAPIFQRLTHRSLIKHFMQWTDAHSFSALFIMLVVPFSPSPAINSVAGLARIKITPFLLALISSKLIKIFTISYIGIDLLTIIRQPIKAFTFIFVIISFWFLGKYLEKRLTRKF